MTVTIKAQPFDEEVYSDCSNCYLAQALHLLGYEKAQVGGDGRVFMNGIIMGTSPTHVTTTTYNCGVVRAAFARKEDLIIELIEKQ